MDNPKGRILSLVDSEDGAQALVAVDTAAACPRCASGKGCGAGLLAGTDRVRQVEAGVSSGLQIAVDDIVELSVPPDNLLRAAILVYGLPMLGAAIGSAAAFAIDLGDAAAAIAALSGLAVGLLISRRRLRHRACIAQFVPVVTKRI